MDFWGMIYDLCNGFGVTLKLFALTLVFAIPLGFVLAFLSMSKIKPISFVTKVFIWVIRGTPLLLQCLIVTFVPSMLFDIPNKDFKEILGLETMADLQFVFVLFAFVVNYACYFSEIYRGGIQSISKGQYEAGKVLGMTKTQIFFKVVLMQVVKRIIPPMSNEIITLVKDTSLARIITFYELIFFAQRYIKNGGLLWPLFYTAVYYLVFTAILTLFFRWLEKKLSYYKV